MLVKLTLIFVDSWFHLYTPVNVHCIGPRGTWSNSSPAPCSTTLNLRSCPFLVWTSFSNKHLHRHANYVVMRAHVCRSNECRRAFRRDFPSRIISVHQRSPARCTSTGYTDNFSIMTDVRYFREDTQWILTTRSCVNKVISVK